MVPSNDTLKNATIHSFVICLGTSNEHVTLLWQVGQSSTVTLLSKMSAFFIEHRYSRWIGWRNLLTVNNTPLAVEKLCYQNPLGQLLKQFSKLYQLWGPVTWPLLEGWYTRNPWFSRFLEYISASLSYLIMKSFLVVRSYRVLVINIKILIVGALATLETRLKVPILAIFWRFCAFLELSVYNVL